ncbi:N-6 DNA methylase [Companilactobacillus jidongensis]|uniref:N-6 DNA methylase n=1 Tax=Companilactobacillus jidongensis TaxID=2486006 RepID=UPI000F76BC12|nr:N-6 DNA methylase [Companilactobacillus jidongensis]
MDKNIIRYEQEKFLKIGEIDNKEIYHIMMVLFVTHDNRKDSIKFLKSHPGELVSLFKDKAEQQKLNFSDNIPKTIDLEMIRNLCDILAKQGPDEDAETILALCLNSDNDLMAELVMDIANVQEDETVLDVEFGYGDILLHLLDINIHQSITGYDVTTLFDVILLVTYLKHASNVNLLHKKISSKSDTNFDWVISISPDIRFDQFFRKMYIADNSNERIQEFENLPWMNIYDYIKLGISKTKPDGRGIFAFDIFDLQGDNPLKRELIENDWITDVIQLGWIAGFVGAVILILDKAKKKNLKKVRMIDASEMTWGNKNNSEITAMKKRILDTLNKNNSYADFVRTVDIDEIVNSGYDLLPEAYVKDRVYKQFEQFDIKVHRSEFYNIKTIELGEIADILGGHIYTTQGNSKSKYRIIMGNNDGDFVLNDFDWLNMWKNYPVSNNMIQKYDILIDGVTHEKVSYVTKSYVNLLFTGTIIRLKDSKFDSRWLAQYLLTPLAKTELKRVYQADFPISKVRVPVIPLASQIAGVRSYNQDMAVINDTRKKITENLNDAKSELYREMGLNKFFK